jgi:hypothetical protein
VKGIVSIHCVPSPRLSSMVAQNCAVSSQTSCNPHLCSYTRRWYFRIVSRSSSSEDIMYEEAAEERYIRTDHISVS